MKLIKILFNIYSFVIYSHLFRGLILIGTLADELPKLNTNIDLYFIFLVFGLTLMLQIFITLKS